LQKWWILVLVGIAACIILSMGVICLWKYLRHVKPVEQVVHDSRQAGGEDEQSDHGDFTHEQASPVYQGSSHPYGYGYDDPDFFPETLGSTAINRNLSTAANADGEDYGRPPRQDHAAIEKNHSLAVNYDEDDYGRPPQQGHVAIDKNYSTAVNYDGDGGDGIRNADWRGV
jgi:hypothetical protein